MAGTHLDVGPRCGPLDPALPSGAAHSLARRPAAASVGIGLKPQHCGELLDGLPWLGFVEIHAENYMGEGGPFHRDLARATERYGLSVHGVGLSLGGEEAPAPAHLERLARLVDRYRPGTVSEHLAWCGHGGVFFNDLLPLPYDEPTLARVARHVDQVQQRLGRQLLLENPATYLQWEQSRMSEGEFLAEVVRRTGCGLLLDLNNAHVSAVNHGMDAMALIDELPLAAVGEIHLAGFARDHDAAGAPLLVDDHGGAVDEAVWTLLRTVIARTGPLPVLVEWDNDVPPLACLVAQAHRAWREIAGLSFVPGLDRSAAVAA